MNSLLNQLNKTFENRVRLGIMSILMVNDAVDFNDLKDNLGLTDGNLASHLKQLEGKGYISVTKTFVQRKPQTTYSVTAEGRQAFQEHLNILEKIVNQKG